MHASVKDTANIVENRDRGIRGNEGEQPHKEGNGILLLLSRCVNVGKEERNVVAAAKRSHAPIIEMLHARFDISSVSSLVGIFATVDSFIWNGGLSRLWLGALPEGVDMVAHPVNLFF